MGKRQVVIVLMSIFSLVCVAICCSSTPTEKGLANEWAAELLQKVPYEASLLQLTDVAAMRTDPELYEIYVAFTQAYAFSGIDFQGIEYYIMADFLNIFIGDSDYEHLRERLNEDCLSHHQISGADAWDCRFETIVAISGEYIVIGDESAVEEWLQYVGSGGQSKYTDQEFRNLINKLPYGFFIMYGERENTEAQEYEGFEAAAGVSSKNESESFIATLLIRFKDEDTAVNAVPLIKDEWENNAEASNVVVTRYRNNVKVTLHDLTPASVNF